jgi:hypothetical protein
MPEDVAVAALIESGERLLDFLGALRKRHEIQTKAGDFA